MACYPRIDSHCPLPAAQTRHISGHCQHCSHTVYNLDTLNDSERQALLSNTQGKICVRYSMALPMALALGLSISAAPNSQAADTANSKTINSVTLPAAPAQGAPLDLEQILSKPAPQPAELEPFVDIVSVIVGGIRNSAEAEWVDDADIPSLPIIQG